MNAKRLIAASLTGMCAVGSVQAVTVYSSIGQNDIRYVQTGCTYANAITTAASFAMWVKDVTVPEGVETAALGGCCHVNRHVSSANGFGFFINPASNEFRAYVFGNNEIHGATSKGLDWCSDNQWHFLMLTADCESQKIKLYRDGVLVGEGALDNVSSISPQRCLQFGGGISKSLTDTSTPQCDITSCPALFSYAEVSLYDSALDADTVASLYVRRVDPFAEHLIGYWPCNGIVGGFAVNWARRATRRADGSAADGIPYYVQTPDDPGFFPLPSGRFVVTPAWAAAHGYIPAADTPANSLACPATNLVYAFSKLENNETLNILPGVHAMTSKATFTKTGITVASFDPETGAGNRLETVIDCSPVSDYAFWAQDNASVNPTFRELTFCNGQGALLFWSAGAPVVESCTFQNFSTTGYGGAIYSYLCKYSVFTNCLFKSCTARKGGAIYTQQNGKGVDDYQTIVDCQFEGCAANTGADVRGGAICSERNNRILGCKFESCFAVGNNTSARGGVVYAGDFSTIAGCTFSGKSHATGSTGTYGGLMDLKGQTTISNCVIAGISEFHGGYGAIHLGAGEVVSGRNMIYGLVCTNNVIDTGLFFMEDLAETVVVRNCLIARGDSTGPTSLTVGHKLACAVFEHVTSDLSVAVGTSGSFSKNIFVNSIALGDVKGEGNHVSIFSNCVVSVARSGADDYNVWRRNPGFVDAVNGDYMLKPGAFAREKGEKLDWQTNGSVDLAGLPRLVSRDGVAYVDDALPDLGCYEAQVMMPGMLLFIR